MLVVISLIGILAALGLVSFTTTQKQARDTTRKSDLKQFQTAFENYANKNNGLYPIYTSAVRSDGSLCTDLGIGGCATDPKDTEPYIYKYISDSEGLKYSMWTGIEAKEGAAYWVVCSNGKVGESATVPSGGNLCPI
jgi:type II secretory pathway pseudopilin PulG